MSVLDWMDIIYPADVALFVGYLVVKASYGLIVRRSVAILSRRMVRLIQAIIVLDWLLALCEAVVLAMLATMTGNEPMLSIDRYRVYVALVRGAMGLILVGCIAVHALAIWEFLHGRFVLTKEN